MKRLLPIILALLLLTGCAAAEPEPTIAPAEGGKALVVYFSRTGEQYSVGVIERGNTAIVAELIAERLGADTFEMIPADQDRYPMTYDELTDVAKTEQRDNARPEYAGEIDLTDYDTIFIGAPVWWGDWPMIMYTFFEASDLSGKALIPFSTHEGSGLSGFDKKLAAAAPEATVLKGLAIRGGEAQSDSDGVREKVKSWLGELGYE